MADFKKAISVIFDHEGKYSNDPHDPGGATKYGISLRYLKTLGEFGDFDGDGDVDIDDIRILTKEDAGFIYQKEWWDKFKYNLIEDDALATKIFDCCINIGPLNAHKLIQRAINLTSPVNDHLNVDGICGPKTIEAINNFHPLSLMMIFRGVLSSYYISVVEKNPNLNRYLVGWLNKKVNDERFPIK